MNEKLPEGWASASLSEVAEINPRHPKGLDDSMPVSFAPMAAISESRPEFNFLEERNLGTVRKGFTHFAEGDVLFAKITPCMENGKAAIASGLRNGLGCGTTELHVLRPRDGVSPKYLYHYVHQDAFRREAARNFTGTAGQLRVPVSAIRDAVIPVPPVDEQRRIVTKLEALLDKAAVSHQRLAKIPLILKRFRQSILAAACSGRLTGDWREQKQGIDVDQSWTPEGGPDVPETWIWKRLSEIAEVRGGVTKGRKFNGKPTVQLAYLRVANVQDGYLDLREIKLIEALPEDREKYALKPGDLLFTEGGDRDKLGRGTVWRGEVADCIHQNHIFRARLKVKDVVPEYLSLATKSEFSRRYFFENASQTVNLASINLTVLSELGIPLPPLDEQREIVRRVQELFALADRVELRYQTTQTHVEKLTESILARAFCGKLVSTEAELAEAEGRVYESAAELLERIRPDGVKAVSRGAPQSAAVSSPRNGASRRRVTPTIVSK